MRDGVPVRLIESEGRVGGKLRASEIAGRMVEEGADAFLARVPHGVELARELGLADKLISPTARKAKVWAGALKPLPEPNVLGIPLDVEDAESLLGPQAASALRADIDRTEPDPVRPDDTIGSLVRRRLGDTIHEALVDPLLGAISAGDTDQLSLAASSPQIMAAAESGPSLVGALRRQVERSDPDAPVFYSFDGGISVLVAALADQLDDHITTGVSVESIDRLPDGLRISLSSGEVVAAPAAVLACPARISARLLVDWPDAAEELAAIPLVSVAFVTLAFEAGAIDIASELSGFVVPRNDPTLSITACSFTTSKWPHLGGDVDLLRISIGHARDQVTPELPDDELLELVLGDVATSLGSEALPVASRITRWPQAFPQYEVGHIDRVARVEGELNPDGLFLAGMAYRGIGIPANIDSGRTAAVQAILHVLE